MDAGLRPRQLRPAAAGARALSVGRDDDAAPERDLARDVERRRHRDPVEGDHRHQHDRHAGRPLGRQPRRRADVDARELHRRVRRPGPRGQRDVRSGLRVGRLRRRPRSRVGRHAPLAHDDGRADDLRRQLVASPSAPRRRRRSSPAHRAARSRRHVQGRLRRADARRLDARHGRRRRRADDRPHQRGRTTDTINGGTAQQSATASITLSAGTAQSIKASVTPVTGAVAYAWFMGPTRRTRTSRRSRRSTRR
jgi:hypothetical protein